MHGWWSNCPKNIRVSNTLKDAHEPGPNDGHAPMEDGDLAGDGDETSTDDGCDAGSQDGSPTGGSDSGEEEHKLVCFLCIFFLAKIIC